MAENRQQQQQQASQRHLGSGMERHQLQALVAVLGRETHVTRHLKPAERNRITLRWQDILPITGTYGNQLLA